MNKKTGLIYSIILLFSALGLTSCGNSDNNLVGNWVALSSDFAGSSRSNAATFVIGNKLYVFGGYNGTAGDWYNDLWVLNVETSTSETDKSVGSWTQLSALSPANATVTNPSTANYGRSDAVGFSIGTKGYIGTGYNMSSALMKDFWQYDPATDKWTQIADFPITPTTSGVVGREGCYSFALNNYGYVGGGQDAGAYYLDCYKYDPAANQWTAIPSVGKKRGYASTFVINNVAYLVGGVNSNGYNYDFWKFDGTTWTALNDIKNSTGQSFDDDYTSIQRSSACAFVLNGKGYLTCGTNGSLLKATWEYDPTTDRWKQKTNFEATVRSGAVGASVNGRGLVMLGKTSSVYLSDLNEFHPDADYNSYD